MNKIMNNNVKEFFDRLAPSWPNDHNINFIESLIDKIEIKEGNRILDLGCGKGAITDLLYNKSKNKVIAIDISPKMIEGAKEIQALNSNKDNFEFICLDFYKYNLNYKFDVIVVFDAYPHFLDVDEFVIICNKILNENGKIAIIHDLSRKELNEIHYNGAIEVSRLLSSPLEEAKKFNVFFTNIYNYEDDKCYVLILEKK